MISQVKVLLGVQAPAEDVVLNVNIHFGFLGVDVSHGHLASCIPLLHLASERWLLPEASTLLHKATTNQKGVDGRGIWVDEHLLLLPVLLLQLLFQLLFLLLLLVSGDHYIAELPELLLEGRHCSLYGLILPLAIISIGYLALFRLL